MGCTESKITTTNLGPVCISSRCIEYFRKHSTDDDIATVTNELIGILQSDEIELLEFPLILDKPNQLEFWVHQSSSMIFNVIPKQGYRVISLVIKSDMSSFVFKNKKL